jgi:hypothetical protein
MRIPLAVISILLSSVLSIADTGIGTNAAPDTHTAAANSKPGKIVISLLVSGDSDYTDVVKSYIKRDLRKLDDVQVMDVGDDEAVKKYGNNGMLISCIILVVKNQTDEKIGCVLSYVVTSQKDNMVGTYLVSGLNIDAEKRNFLLRSFNNAGELVDHFAKVTRLERLETEVQENVAYIDGTSIEKFRKELNTRNE